MELGEVYPPPPLGSHPPRPAPGPAGLSPSPRQHASAQDHVVRIPRGQAPREPDSAKEPALRLRSGGRGAAGPAGLAKSRLSPKRAPRPLRPLAERKSQEESAASRRAKDHDRPERAEIVSDGASSGREGRHFTVSNVGNNGRIYLRYCCLVKTLTSINPRAD
jgi:hypothetical protein